MKCLITGNLGFIFSHVTEYFQDKYDVIGIDAMFSYSHPEVKGNWKQINADLSKEGAWRLIFDERPDYIIHAAAITDVDYSIENPRLVIDNNVNATLNVFKAAKRLDLKKLVYINTDEVYGECEQKKSETDLLFPRNPYAASKAMCSHIRTSFDVTYPQLRDRTAEVRMCNVFGERQDTRKIMPLLREACTEGIRIPLQENGDGYREYIHVANVGPILDLILEKGNRIYNITHNEGFTVNELIAKIETITGKKIETYPSRRQSHDRYYRMDNSRLIDLGWNPVVSFEEGLKRYVEAV